MKAFHVGIKGVVRREDGAVLLLKKNSENPFWEIPGGRIDANETIDETLIREINEELPGSNNVQIKRILCAHRLPKDIAPDLSLMLLYFEVSADIPNPVVLSEEHTDSRWVRSARELEVDGGTKKALEAIFEG